MRPRNPANGAKTPVKTPMFKSEVEKGDTNGHSNGLSQSNSGIAMMNGSTARPHITLAKLLPAPVGLSNSGVNCFFNASIQTLFACPAFADFISNVNSILPRSPAGVVDVLDMLSGLAGEFQSAEFRKRKVLNAINILRAVRKASRDAIQANRQEDAHESMCVLFDMMEKACLRRLGLPATSRVDRTSESTIIHSLFGGSLTTTTKCPSCSNSSPKTETFLQLSLELDPVRAATIPQLLRKMSIVEKLDAKNMWECDKCKTKVRAERQTVVSKTPSVLIVHLKRFGFSFMNGSMKRTKLKTPVPLDSEDLVIDCNGSKVGYSMVGVLIHQGASVHSGHYYAYVKCSRNGFWYEVDDEMVARTQSKRVLSEEQAYMVMFCRKDQMRLNQVPLPSGPFIMSPRPGPLSNGTPIKQTDQMIDKKQSESPPSRLFRSQSNDESVMKRLNLTPDEPLPSDQTPLELSLLTPRSDRSKGTAMTAKRASSVRSFFGSRGFRRMLFERSGTIIRKRLFSLHKIKFVNRSSSEAGQSSNSTSSVDRAFIGTIESTASSPSPNPTTEGNVKKAGVNLVNGVLLDNKGRAIDEEFSFDKKTPKKMKFRDAWEDALDKGKTKKVRSLS